jgi:phosphate transport system permease protein
VLLLLSLLLALAAAGLPAIDMDFLVQDSRSFGGEGGVFYQIIGSLFLVLGTGFLTGLLALGTAIAISELLKSERFKKRCELFLQVLNGVPSIVFGVFGLILFVDLLGLGVSWIAGVFVLTTMILPMTILSTYHRIRSIPVEEERTALLLGADRWEWIRKGTLSRGMGGLTTGLMLGMARAIGETAPIMFVATAFSGVGMPDSFQDPVVTLPTHILELAQQASNEEALQNAWGASLVLVLLVMLLSTLASEIRKRTDLMNG